MKAHRVAQVTLCLVLCVMSVAAAGGTATLEQWVLAAGNGETGSSHVAVHQVMGQPVVGTSSGEHVSLRAGYEVGAAQPPIFEVHLPLVMRVY